MSKLDTGGIEVSAKELVVALRREAAREPLRSFANTAEGHQALIRYLRRAGRGVRVYLEATGLYGLDLALALSAQAGIAGISHQGVGRAGLQPRRNRTFLVIPASRAPSRSSARVARGARQRESWQPHLRRG